MIIKNEVYSEVACPVFGMRLIMVFTCVESQIHFTFKFDK